MEQKNIEKGWHLVSHTADLQIRVFGKTVEELFKNSLRGMFESIRPESKYVQKTDTTFTILDLPIKRPVSLQAPTRELLLIDFLSECLYLSDVHNEAYFDVKFKLLEEKKLDAEVLGMPITRFEVVEIKAVTYHENKITHKDGIWTTDIVFDI